MSHKTRQALTGLLVAVPIALTLVNWLLTPAAITKLPQLPSFTESPNALNVRVSSSSEDNAGIVAAAAKESRCTSEPVNISGETYKCATRSGLTAFFVLPSAEPSIQLPIRSQESETSTLERRSSTLR